MAHALVNHTGNNNDAGTTAPSATITAATAGNTLFAIFGWGGFAIALSGVTAGFAKQATFNNGGDSYMEWWTKTAAGGETTVAGTLGTSEPWGMWVGEYSAVSGTIDQSANSGSGNGFGVTTISSGTTGTTTTAAELGIAAMIASSPSLTVSSWSNSFTQIDHFGRLYVATRDLSSLATYSTAPTWTGAVDVCVGLGTFADAGGGGGGILVPELRSYPRGERGIRGVS